MGEGQWPKIPEFYWQAGYGAFSVSQSNLDEVKKLHREPGGASSEDDFSRRAPGIVSRHGMEFDERFVWD